MGTEQNPDQRTIIKTRVREQLLFILEQKNPGQRTIVASIYKNKSVPIFSCWRPSDYGRLVVEVFPTVYRAMPLGRSESENEQQELFQSRPDESEPQSRLETKLDSLLREAREIFRQERNLAAKDNKRQKGTRRAPRK